MSIFNKMLFVTGCTLVIGCHMFEDPENLDPCPLGSGYPCSCDLDEDAMCDDNNRCHSMTDSYQGFCTARCHDRSDCANTEGWGLEAVCALAIDGDVPEYCVLVCDDGVLTADCPPGQSCLWQDHLDFGVCLPTG